MRASDSEPRADDRAQPDDPPRPTYREHPADEPHSWGNVDERHWSRTRADANREALDYYRKRSHAPGVEEGGGPRNSYCMSCDGVLPLDYAQFEPASGETRSCPHCGVELDPRVQRMFNWVEIDQPHAGDFKALLPLLVGGLVLLALVGWLAVALLGG